MIREAGITDEVAIALFAVIPVITFDAWLHDLATTAAMFTVCVLIRTSVALVAVITEITALEERWNRCDQVEVAFVQQQCQCVSFGFSVEHATEHLLCAKDHQPILSV